MGAQMVRKSSKANDLAGDGTTTATVLAQAIVTEGLKVVAAGMNPMDLEARYRQGGVLPLWTSSKKRLSPFVPTQCHRQVGTISANSDARR